MLDFDKYLMRYGEFGVQYLIEQMERAHSIATNTKIPLEQRWATIMECPTPANFKHTAVFA